MDIAIVSVITTGVVGLTAALGPTLIRHADRKFEKISKREEREYMRREHYWTLRESLYLDLLGSQVGLLNTIFLLQHGASEDSLSQTREPEEPTGPRVTAYASDQVRELDDSFSKAIARASGDVKPQGEEERSIDWLKFARFVHELMEKQIRKELIDGQISLKGVGDSVDYNTLKARYQLTANKAGSI